MNATGRFISTGLVLLGLLAPLPQAHAADYQGTIRILVGFPPGGATDVAARLLAEKLRESMGQPVLVENKPGAGGTLVTQQLKSMPADGSVVLLTVDGPHVVTPMTLKDRPYDATTDFTALAGVAQYYNSLAASGTINVRNMAEFGTWLKANRAKASFGTPAAGGVTLYAGQMVGRSLGVDLVNVPYRGGAPLVTDLVGGQIPAAVASLTDFLEYHKVGKVRVIAVSGDRRSKIAPEIPTFQELGLKGIDKNPWLAFFGPKNMPREFVDRFSAAVAGALRQPDVADKLIRLGNEVAYLPPAQLQELVNVTAAHWAPIIRDSGVPLQ